MLSLTLQELSQPERHNWLLHAIAPRPICLASTIDRDGNVNLSPFSFFNLFSSQPPIAIFSPARRGRDNTVKHTLENVMEVPEVGIHICDYDMVQQMSLSSCEYPKGVDEFLKAGFTKQDGKIIRPPLVLDAKVKFECRVTEIKSLGNEGGAGQLVFAEILMMHVDESVLNTEQNMIDQEKLQLIARLGGDWYSLVNKQSLFIVEKPNKKLGIGIDALPASVKNSRILTGNHLGQLGNLHELPDIDPSFEDETLKNIIGYFSNNPEIMENEVHTYAAKLLDRQEVSAAWQVLLTSTL
jgi:flavin reductase (DIM6/NTAB) family NADH-FMN oxidoreductase RutF